MYRLPALPSVLAVSHGCSSGRPWQDRLLLHRLMLTPAGGPRVSAHQLWSAASIRPFICPKPLPIASLAYGISCSNSQAVQGVGCSVGMCACVWHCIVNAPATQADLWASPVLQPVLTATDAEADHLNSFALGLRTALRPNQLSKLPEVSGFASAAEMGAPLFVSNSKDWLRPRP